MKNNKISLAKQELSDDLLFESYEERNQKKRLKLIQESIEHNPYNIDSLLALSSFTENPFLRLEDLQLIIDMATLQLENDEEDYFGPYYIGHFWGVVETRPFMRANHTYILTLMETSLFHEAIHLCRQLLVLNTNDNMGIRYLLMKLYAIVENHEEAELLNASFEDQTFSFKLPYALTLYHCGRYEQAKAELTQLFEKYPFARSIMIYNKKPSEKDLEHLSLGIPIGKPGEVYAVLDEHSELITNNFKNWLKKNFKTKAKDDHLN